MFTVNCQDNKISVRISNFGSMFRFIFTDFPVKSRKERDMYELPLNIQNMFYRYLLDQGVYIGSNRINFISTVHTKYLLDEFIAKVINSFDKLRECGLI